MRQIIVNSLFSFVDIASLTLCSWYPVLLMAGGKKIVQNRILFRAIRIVAWLGFSALTVLLPTFGRDDFLTLTVLLSYYLAVGYFYIILTESVFYINWVLCFLCMQHK